MNKKERTLKAIETLMEWYKNGDTDLTDCPLCTIHIVNGNCLGCPNYNSESPFISCCKMLTFIEFCITKKPRLKFWQRGLPRLKKEPAWKFTEKNKEGFPYLWELDREIFNKYKNEPEKI